MAENAPNLENLCRARYGYNLHIYTGSGGLSLLKVQDTGVIKGFIKIDRPHEPMVTFPKFLIDILIEKDTHVLISSYKKDLIVQLSMVVREEQKGNDKATEHNGIISEEILFDLKFQALIESAEDTRLMASENQGIADNPDGSAVAQGSDVAQQFKIVRLNLSCIEHRNRFKKAINFNVTEDGESPSVLPFDVLAYGIGQCVTEAKSVILQNPDNNEPQLQVIVPPWNLRDFCNFIQTVYNGIYKTGMLIYQDLKYLFVIPKYSDQYAIPDNEFNVIHIYVLPSEMASASNVIGYYKDTDKNEYTVTCGGPDAFTPLDTSEALKELKGNKFKVFSSVDNYRDNKGDDSGSVSYDSESWGGSDIMPEFDADIKGATPDAKDKIRYYHNELSNDTLVDELISGMQFNQRMVTVATKDINFALLTFNRKYSLTILTDTVIDAEYGGDYELLQVTHIGQMTDNEPLSSVSTLTLLKKP